MERIKEIAEVTAGDIVYMEGNLSIIKTITVTDDKYHLTLENEEMMEITPSDSLVFYRAKEGNWFDSLAGSKKSD